MNKPRILYFDIETTPLLLTAWSIGKIRVTHENIFKEREVACIGYKWGGERKVKRLVFNFHKFNILQRDDDADLAMLVEFTKLANQADILIGHNLKRFDVGVIRSRLVRYNLPDMHFSVIDDTYILCKGIAFTSHKLDYLTQFTGIGKKASHPYKYWTQLMRKSKNALRLLVKYCKQDVRITERWYHRIKKYIKSKLNMAIFNQNPNMCPAPLCGGTKLEKVGFRQTVGLGLRQRLRCKKCGRGFTTGVNQIKNAKEYPR